MVILGHFVWYYDFVEEMASDDENYGGDIWAMLHAAIWVNQYIVESFLESVASGYLWVVNVAMWCWGFMLTALLSFLASKGLTIVLNTVLPQ